MTELNITLVQSYLHMGAARSQSFTFQSALLQNVGKTDVINFTRIIYNSLLPKCKSRKYEW